LLGQGSEIFIPKLRAYTIKDVKNALMELLSSTGEEKIPVREGEKFHETLINYDEMRYTWELNSNYIILNQSLTEKEINAKYPGIKRVDSSEPYSSNLVEKISKDTLKKIIKDSKLLEQ
jgi:FlaA1/EpsC-like NDP-sugar epimerase